MRADLVHQHPSVRPMRPVMIVSGPDGIESLKNWEGLDLNVLAIFVALMAERNLTRAAQRVGVSQPAASRALARLRHMLKDELFIKSPGGMLPTPRAEQIAEPIREALSTLGAALKPEGNAFNPEVATYLFSLVANNYAARTVIPGLDRYLSARAPYIKLDVEPLGNSDALDRLDQGKDLVFAPLMDGGERYKCVRLLEDDFVVVLDRRHPVCGASVLTLEHLASIPHVVISAGDATGFIDETLNEHGLHREIAVRVPLVSAIRMLLGSDRLAILPRRIATDLAGLGRLATRDLPFASPRTDIAMIWHRRVDNHPAHGWCAELYARALWKRL